MIQKDTIAEPHSPDRGLLESLDLSRLPRHVAVIMDGNGRWARRRSLPRVEGHRAGIAAVRSTVETGARLELEALTPALGKALLGLCDQPFPVAHALERIRDLFVGDRRCQDFGQQAAKLLERLDAGALHLGGG